MRVLHSIGSRRAAGDLVDLLLECHQRIRSFVALAGKLTPTAAAAEVGPAAAAIGRYFRQAYPLHVADEEVDIAPRLRGRELAVDQALATTGAEHREHQAAIDRLVALCTALTRDPVSLPSHADELAAVVAALEAGLLAHLELEERVVFPALRGLEPAVSAAILAAMRVRRSS